MFSFNPFPYCRVPEPQRSCVHIRFGEFSPASVRGGRNVGVTGWFLRCSAVGIKVCDRGNLFAHATLGEL